MSSVGSFYAQRDNRLINVPLTGYNTDNGIISGVSDLYHAAVASLDVTNSKLFTIDTRNIVLRNSGVEYLVGITFPNILPPQYYPGFEINIIINVKDTNVPSPAPLTFRIQQNPAVPIDYADERTYIELDNLDYADTTDALNVYTYGRRTVTLISTGQEWVVKSSFLNNGPSSIYM
jgi:hypothetical protein